jgi:hypothetical protein
MLFALRKRGRLTDEELKKLDKTWQRYRSKNRLDARAKKISEPGSDFLISRKLNPSPGQTRH